MLKFFRAFVCLAILLLPSVLKAQNCSYPYLGTKSLYPNAVYKNSTAPAGYQPVFINYVGRHGARHLTKEVNTSYAYGLMMKADSMKALTPQGLRLRNMLMALDKVEHGAVKSISAEGVQELEGIAKRMYQHYPQVFVNTPKLNVGITKEIRTKQSADAFLNGLKSGLKNKPEIKEYTDDTNLRFYDASPVYTAFENNGSWQKPMAQLQQNLKTDAINAKLSRQWLAPAIAKTLKPAEMDKLVNDVFGFATIVASLKTELQQAGIKPAGVDFASLFTCDELVALSKIDVADDYLKKGPGSNNNGIQVRVAVPLLVNFINTTDDFIKNGGITAQLRFAHAETIAPFAALLEITKANKVATDLTKLSEAWQSSQVIPLSANIQWIYYRKQGSHDLLVKVLLNEQEAHIQGLQAGQFPYYKWSALRAYYMNKLSKLHVKLTDNMQAYLTQVK